MSSAAAFAAGGVHMPADATPLPPHQQRVLDERMALSEKWVKLDDFITKPNPVFSTLPAEEQRLLERQAELMSDYLEVLDQRIARWGK